MLLVQLDLEFGSQIRVGVKVRVGVRDKVRKLSMVPQYPQLYNRQVSSYLLITKFLKQL